MSPKQIWFTANPNQGTLDVFPKWASDELTTAHAAFLEDPDDHTLGSHLFGERFFGATIHFYRDGVHHQTTTSGGLRSVGCVEVQDGNTPDRIGRWVARTNSGWGSSYRLVAGERPEEFGVTRERMAQEPAVWREVEVPAEYGTDAVEHQKRAFWEWCRVTPDGLQQMLQDRVYDTSMTLKRLPAKHWVAYDDTQAERLETAWQEGETETEVEVGIRRFTVSFEENRVWARQRDATDPSRVRVARRNPNLSPHEVAERQAAAEALQAQVCEGAVCGICLEGFDGPIRRVRLAPSSGDPGDCCGHVFHAPCMHAQLVHTIKTGYGEPIHQCPLCRAEFSTHEYTEWTGETVKMPSIYGR